MGVSLDIPGRGSLELEHLVLDVNGTLTDRGRLIEGVAERLAAIRASLEITILSADTLGTLDSVAAGLGIRAERVASGAEKAERARELGPERCVAIGNGENDAAMLEQVALGIAVVGREGAAAGAVRAADVLCASILDALDLLLDEAALVATLRR